MYIPIKFVVIKFSIQKGRKQIMSNVNLAIIYYSMTGTNYKLSNWAAEGAKENGAQVKVLKVQELAPQSIIDTVPAWKAHIEATKNVPEATQDDLEWADAIIFSTATRFGGPASQIKQFIDSASSLWAKGKLVNKVVSAMSSASNTNGGQEAAILSIYTSMFHWGAIIAAPGYSDPITFAAGGNPYGTSATISMQGKFTEDLDSLEKAVKHQAKRTVEIAAKIKQK